MKKFFSFLLPALLATGISNAQNVPDKLDTSPMDMSYSPAGYPGQMIQKKFVGGPNARIIYSRPQLKGRTMLGDKEKYNAVWRLGANESTELEMFKDGTIGGKKLAKGRYTVYALIDSAKWSVIINRATDSWGAFSYDSTKDVLRVDAAVQTIAPQENVTIYFDNSNNLVMMWDKAKVVIPVTFTNPATMAGTKPKAAAQQ